MKTALGYQLGKNSRKTSLNRIYVFEKKQNNYLDEKDFLLNYVLKMGKKIISDNNNMSTNNISSGNCCCNGTITLLNDVDILNCNSNINITNIPTDQVSQDKAENIYNGYLVPTEQPTTIQGKAPLVYTKMLDKLLHSIYEEFVTNPRIIRLFDAFNYCQGSQMSVSQYDNIVKACVLFWRAKNFELLKQDPKLCFNFCILNQLCDKFFVSYKPVVYNNDKLIDIYTNPNYGANGYTQWLGNYIGTKAVDGISNSKQHVYVDGYKFNAARALTEGQHIQTCGFTQKTRKLCTSFNGETGGDINFQWMLGELNTTVTPNTITIGGNTIETIIEKNALGQSKISKTTRNNEGKIIAMSVLYVDELIYDIINDFIF
jgi:hypothetical protein